jgi:hypothetical protein
MNPRRCYSGSWVFVSLEGHESVVCCGASYTRAFSSDYPRLDWAVFTVLVSGASDWTVDLRGTSGHFFLLFH